MDGGVAPGIYISTDFVVIYFIAKSQINISKYIQINSQNTRPTHVMTDRVILSIKNIKTNKLLIPQTPHQHMHTFKT